MLKEYTNLKSSNFTWIDITNPTLEELQNIASIYSLHPSSVQDCLEPDHLPKIEEFEDSTFIVTRIFDSTQKNDADTIQEVSRKISIFYSSNFLITIHRSEQSILEELNSKYVQHGKCKDVNHLLYIILNKVVMSYKNTADKLEEEIDFYESKIFLKTRVPDLLKSLYRIKRKGSVINRILFLSKDIINNLEEDDVKDPIYRDIVDNYVKMETVYDQIIEQINNLLSLYLSISSQRTNEVIRVLTIFSVFFMPLTFIVGIYGMNFTHMPEINWEYGYTYSIALMIIITGVIYYWFYRKGWL